MRINDFIISLSVPLLCISLTACQIDEQKPSYTTINNTLSDGGETITWKEGQGLLNINNIQHKLNEEDKLLFSKSLEWFATESHFSFEKLSGKTEKQTVDIINCIKLSKPNMQKSCF
ncbi:MAG: hypothetical protein COB30_002360 [Ectothiorhodospiraceae bacterium]|nr:hypothetical protein [Ectothiorhodospiraceae bacterium]